MAIEYEEFEFIDDDIWDKALNEPYNYSQQRVIGLAERYNNAAQHPNYSTIPAAIMEYTSQKWLWEALFPDEKDAFPGVYPRQKQSARLTGNTPNTQTVTAANTGVSISITQTGTAANTGVSINITQTGTAANTSLSINITQPGTAANTSTPNLTT